MHLSGDIAEAFTVLRVTVSLGESRSQHSEKFIGELFRDFSQLEATLPCKFTQIYHIYSSFIRVSVISIFESY